MRSLPTVTKQRVRTFWEDEACGIRYGEGQDAESFYRSMEEQRYALEPYIPAFALFEAHRAKRVLEIGVGAGVDLSRFVLHGARAFGVDLTAVGLLHTANRMKLLKGDLTFALGQADAENLPFQDSSFDLVYSWGVLHHTPDTERAFSEAFRVLTPGGTLKAMVYHVPSWTAWMLWLRYGLLRGRLLASPRRCMYENLESPGTKAYTVAQGRRMLEGLGFTGVRLQTKLGPGDLLAIRPSRRYQRLLYRLVWALYPRWLVRLLGHRFGLYLLMTAQKPPAGERTAQTP